MTPKARVLRLNGPGVGKKERRQLVERHDASPDSQTRSRNGLRERSRSDTFRVRVCPVTPAR
jgi:hypothetical protein